jgi:hypothetical protein
LGCKGKDVTGDWRRSFNVLLLAGHNYSRWSVWIYIEFVWGNVREGDHLDDPGVDLKIILKWIFKR